MIQPNATSLPSGPFSPGQTQSTYFALYADDCLLHFALDELTPKQLEDHEANIALTAMLQVALTFMGREQDHAALHDKFLDAPWAETLTFYNGHFKALFDNIIPPTNYHYFPREGFYEAIADTHLPTELLSLYMVSGSNLALHDSRQAWELSQKVNSKMHFAATAPAAGIPVPETTVLTKATLASAGHAFFERHPAGAILKIQGLAGSRNVAPVASLEQAQAYVDEFPDDLQVLLQQQLDTSEFVEMTVDLNVRDSGVEITNTRKILFADGLWVGNYLSPSVTLSAQQRKVCLQVGDYVRKLGYCAPQGFNCGIDFFVRADSQPSNSQPTNSQPTVVIEINARWTGGLFPAQLIDRLGVHHEDCVAFIDIISTKALPKYLDFIRHYGTSQTFSEQGFRIVPMGFSPFTQTLDGIERMYVWQVIVGNYAEFAQQKNQVLGSTELPTANLITL